MAATNQTMLAASTTMAGSTVTMAGASQTIAAASWSKLATTQTMHAARKTMAESTVTIAGAGQTISASTHLNYSYPSKQGLPIPAVVIPLEELEHYTSTNPDGTFHIQKFRKALYHITISAPGYRTKTIPVVTLLGKTISLNISIQKDLPGTEKTFLRKVA